MTKDDNGITLNGPIFGAVMTLLLVVIIIGGIYAMVVTKGLAAVLLVLLGLLGALSYGAFILLREFYRWASRGFKAEPSNYRWY